MQNIRPISVDPAYLADRDTDVDYRAVTRAACTVDDYDPVIVTIKIGTHSAWMRVECAAPGTWWRCPDATARRRMMDSALSELGLRRTDRVIDGQGWSWSYQIGRWS